jgi:hypothetical protein
MKALDRDAVLLYLFLAAVSDAHGISFYSDPSLGKQIKLTADTLARARTQLIDQQLILYHYPLYQVLPLPQKVTQRPRVSSTSPPPPPISQGISSSDEPIMSFREFLQRKGLKLKAVLGEER